MNTDETQYLCTECINDEEFSDFIKRNGEIGNCDFSEEHQGVKIISVEKFASEVDNYFQSNYQIGVEYPEFDLDSDKVYYSRWGETYDNIIDCDVGFEENGSLAAVLNNLPELSYSDLKDGAPPLYDDSQTYERVDDALKRECQDMEYWYQEQIDFKWNEFCDVVIFQSRYFKAKEMLDELFGKPEGYKDTNIKFFKTIKKGEKLFRSRIVKDEDEHIVTNNPDFQLGMPICEKAGHGRLNSEFIPVWYVSFNPEVTIAEVRPSIANKVFIGNFKLKKDVRVFDITALTEEYPKQSGNEFSKFEFISELDKQMSKPISVHEAKRDYIPTQVITEYIREYFDCDGIIYSSSLYKKEGKNCSNIVLFDDSPEFSESEVLEYIDYEIVEIEDIEYKKKLNITN